MNKKSAAFLCLIFVFVLNPVAHADGKDFHDQDLTGKNYNKQILNGANFSDAVLKGAQFATASLKKANFKGADLTGATFAAADLTEADLRETVGLYAASNLSNANLEGVTFSIAFDTKFRGANLKKCKIALHMGSGDFSGADLRGANLRGVRFDATDRFRNAIYDEDTAWPDGFDFKAAGAVLAKPDEKKQ